MVAFCCFCAQQWGVVCLPKWVLLDHVNRGYRCRRPADRSVRVDRRRRAPPGPLDHQAEDIRPRVERDLYSRGPQCHQVCIALFLYCLAKSVHRKTLNVCVCSLGITVFHDAAIPPDDFVANCTIPLDDIMHRDKDATDFWVSDMTRQPITKNTITQLIMKKTYLSIFKFNPS